jgi:hypothetical protein
MHIYDSLLSLPECIFTKSSAEENVCLEKRS